jgi:hypothetical protein
VLYARSPRNSDSLLLDFYNAQSQLKKKLIIKPFHIIRKEAGVVYLIIVRRAHRYYNSIKGLYN